MAKRPLDIETGCQRIRLQHFGSLPGREQGQELGLSDAALSLGNSRKHNLFPFARSLCSRYTLAACHPQPHRS